MPKKIFLSMDDISGLMDSMINRILEFRAGIEYPERIYGIPRGGVPVAWVLAERTGWTLVDTPVNATILVDDIIDSGNTMRKFLSKLGALDLSTMEKKAGCQIICEALVHRDASNYGDWFVFPWEATYEGEETSAEDIVTRQLEFIGEDIKRDGLLETPKRVVKAWGEIFSGYQEKPDEILSKAFENEAKYDEMVILRDIEFFSTCEHHLMPFFGSAHIAYIPAADGKVVGISKLARLVNCFARRLQIQERLTSQIADAIQSNLKAQGVAVIIEATHLCMVMRGVQKQNSKMITSKLLGNLNKDAARMEFILLKGGR